MASRSPLLIALAVLLLPLSLDRRAKAAPDIDGKVVLANLDRYDAIVRFGTTTKEIAPRKATIVAPKKYPITFEFWSGNKASAWKKKSISAAGMYGFNFNNGQCVLAPLKTGTGQPPTRRARTVNRPVIRPRRSSSINVDRRFWHPLSRVVWAGAELYRFIRDEEDRDLLRAIILRGREEDLRDLERWLRDAAIPDLYKDQIRHAFDELSKLSDND